MCGVKFKSELFWLRLREGDDEVADFKYPQAKVEYIKCTANDFYINEYKRLLRGGGKSTLLFFPLNYAREMKNF